jgi:hypothetical protein
MDKSSRDKLNLLKYTITQELIQDQFLRLDETLFEEFIHVSTTSFLSAIERIQTHGVDSQSMTYFIESLSAYCEICSELDTFFKTSGITYMIYSLLTQITPLKKMQDTLSEHLRMILSITKDTVMTHMEKMTEYTDEIVHVYLFLLKNMEDKLSITHHIAKCLNFPISVQTKYDLSIYQYLYNIKSFDYNVHANIYYECVQNAKKSQTYEHLIEHIKVEKLISNHTRVFFDKKGLMKYIWSIVTASSLIEEMNEYRICLLSKLIHTYSQTIQETFLVKYILNTLIDEFKSVEYCSDCTQVVITSLFEHLNTYNYLATMISLEDIETWASFGVKEELLFKKIKYYTSLVEEDSEYKNTDILTSEYILHPYSIKNGDKEITLDRSTVEQIALESGQNPFTREPLTLDMVL